jgi:hypothetical protein
MQPSISAIFQIEFVTLQCSTNLWKNEVVWSTRHELFFCLLLPHYNYIYFESSIYIFFKLQNYSRYMNRSVLQNNDKK